MNELVNCCPYCCAPIGKIHACHPFSSDAGEYYVCDVCGATFEPEEYQDLVAEAEDLVEEARLMTEDKEQ